MNIMQYYIDMIRKKTLEEFKARMAPLLSHVTRRRIMTRAPIEKKDVTLLHGTGSSSVVALLCRLIMSLSPTTQIKLALGPLLLGQGAIWGC